MERVLSDQASQIGGERRMERGGAGRYDDGIRGVRRIERTCIAAPDRAATNQVTSAPASATGPGALCELSGRILASGRHICRADALFGDLKHFAAKGLGMRACFAHWQTGAVAMPVFSVAVRVLMIAVDVIPTNEGAVR